MEDKVVILTGASRGIGKKIAERLAKEKFQLALFSKNKSSFDDLKSYLNKIEKEALYFSGDIADPEFVNSSVEKVIEKYGRVDCLINNAGVGYFDDFLNSTLDKFKEQINVNLFGVYNFMKSVTPSMIKNSGGLIINISSMAGKFGFVGGSTYVPTKHAVNGLTKTAFLELRKHNIRVCALCPGSVQTDMLQSTRLEPKEGEMILEPEDVVDVVLTIMNLPDRATVSEIEIRPTKVR